MTLHRKNLPTWWSKQHLLVMYCPSFFILNAHMVWVGRGGNITIIDYTTTACLLSEEEIMYKTLFHCDISTGTIHRETAAWTWGSQMVAWLGGCVLLLLLLELVACNILTGKKLLVLLLSHPWWRSSDNVNLLGSLFSRSPSFFTKKPWVANEIITNIKSRLITTETLFQN